MRENCEKRRKRSPSSPHHPLSPCRPVARQVRWRGGRPLSRAPLQVSVTGPLPTAHEYTPLTLDSVYNVARNITYPVDFCVNFDLSRTIWFQWLSHDVAYLHSVLLATSAMHDFIMQRPPAKTTYFHLRKTIAFLNERLSDSAVSLRDSTVAVVLTLVELAGVLGDYAAVRAHIAGLQQMVRLRGGLAKLHIKIGR
jgi:hypothetical protein